MLVVPTTLNSLCNIWQVVGLNTKINLSLLKDKFAYLFTKIIPIYGELHVHKVRHARGGRGSEKV